MNEILEGELGQLRSGAWMVDYILRSMSGLSYYKVLIQLNIDFHGARNSWALSRSIAGDNERHDSTCIFLKGGLVTDSYTE